MTDKEKAEEYVIKNVCGYCNRCDTKGYIGCDTYRLSKKAYLDGLTEGRKETYELYDTEADDIAKDYAERLKKLEQQISRMKNCFNCDNILDCRQYDSLEMPILRHFWAVIFNVHVSLYTFIIRFCFIFFLCKFLKSVCQIQTI